MRGYMGVTPFFDEVFTMYALTEEPSCVIITLYAYVHP